MTRYLRAELVLPLTIAAAAAMVAASEFMTTFEFTTGGEPLAVSLASDRHSYALLILAVLTVAGTAYAIFTGLRAAAVGTAVLGLATLLLFLVLDLPDAGKAGPLDDNPALYFANARVDPATGFWLEAVGTVVLGLATVAFATLSSAQLRAWPELIAARRKRRSERDVTSKPQPSPKEDAPPRREKPEPKRRKSAGEPEAKRRKSAVGARSAARKRPSRERSRVASEERAASPEQLARNNGKADSPEQDAGEEPEEESRPGLLRRPGGNDG